jgi:hypothetical protein
MLSKVDEAHIGSRDVDSNFTDPVVSLYNLIPLFIGMPAHSTLHANVISFYDYSCILSYEFRAWLK